jgi:hypothetical protein
MRAEGVSADLRVYRTQALSFWRIREVPATWVALWEAYVARPSTSSRPTGESLASPIGVGDGT